MSLDGSGREVQSLGNLPVSHARSDQADDVHFGLSQAPILRLAAEGMTGAEIADRTGCTEPTVIKWRRQYAERGLAGNAPLSRVSAET